MKIKSSPSSKITRCIRAPIRFLIKAKDYYVKSMMSHAGALNYGGVVTMPGMTLPRSFSGTTWRDSDDSSELIRLASLKRREGEKVDKAPPKPTISKGVPRSFSVGIGKIDEDKPCEFNEDFKVNSDLLYLRSRSYAVTKRRMSVLP